MKKAVTWISGIVTAVISLVMNLVLIPEIESTTEGIRCFDMNSLGYSYETAEKFLSLLSENGRHVYLHVQLPLDFVYPVAYTVFFILLITFLTDKHRKLCAFPGMLMAFDYIENICSVKMLTSDTLSPMLAGYASVMTVAKSITMYICFGIIAVLLIAKLVNKKKNKVTEK